MKKYQILFVALFIFIIDQITKYIIKSTMLLYQSNPVWGDFFRITYVENTGMAFGISIGDNMVFTVLASIASVAILIYFFRMKGNFFVARLAMSIIFGGALGNLFDRFTRGSVVDFLDFEFININIPQFDFFFLHFPGYSMTRWPVFNVADIAVTVGMLILLIFISFEKEEKISEDERLDTGV